MTEEPDNIVLRYLRRIDEKLNILVADVQDLKVRATNAEEALAGVNRRSIALTSALCGSRSAWIW